MVRLFRRIPVGLSVPWAPQYIHKTLYNIFIIFVNERLIFYIQGITRKLVAWLTLWFWAPVWAARLWLMR